MRVVLPTQRRLAESDSSREMVFSPPRSAMPLTPRVSRMAFSSVVKAVCIPFTRSTGAIGAPLSASGNTRPLATATKLRDAAPKVGWVIRFLDTSKRRASSSDTTCGSDFAEERSGGGDGSPQLGGPEGSSVMSNRYSAGGGDDEGPLARSAKGPSGARDYGLVRPGPSSREWSVSSPWVPWWPWPDSSSCCWAGAMRSSKNQRETRARKRMPGVI